MIRVCVAGATGWVGKCLVPAILASEDCQLSGAVSRTHAGTPVADFFGLPEKTGVRITATVEEALAAPTDVFVDYTRPDVVLGHVSAALRKGVAAVIGTSGLSDDDYRRIDEQAQAAKAGVLAAGNFAITAVLLQHFAAIAARYIPHWEIIDYAHGDKVDAPSGTTRELAYRLATAGKPKLLHPIEQTQGPVESRGATLNGTQIHSVRLPGFVIAAEVLFGLPDERLSIRHDAGTGAGPYVAGTLLAIRAVRSFTGLKRGLDSVLDLR